jgi:hypothetical protein
MSMPRVRRASAPSRVFWKYNADTGATSFNQTVFAQAAEDRISSGLKADPRLVMPRDRQALSVDAAADRAAQHNRFHYKNVLHETFFDAVYSIQGRVTKATSSVCNRYVDWHYFC